MSTKQKNKMKVSREMKDSRRKPFNGSWEQVHRTIILLCTILLLSYFMCSHSNCVDAFVLKKTQLFRSHYAQVNGPSSILYSPHNEDHISKFELVFEDDDSSRNVVLTKKQKLSKRKRRQLAKKRNSIKTQKLKNDPVSSDELAEHVSTSYANGQGDTMQKSYKRTRRREASSILYASDPSHRNHAQYLQKLDGHPALVLNADFQPLSVLPLSLWSWQETVKAVFSGKVQVVDVYPDVYIRAVNLNMPLPGVVALTEYVAQKHQRPAFTRRNIYLRDGYKCQYCGNLFRTNDLSLDHVLPRCKGGKLIWENTVTSCRKCNGRKGSLLPTKLPSVGMKLLREPFVPSKFELATEANKLKPRKAHPIWAPYLGVGWDS